MKKVALALVGVLIVAVAVAVAKQLSSEAMAVIVGIVCGIGASIPVSLAMIAMMEWQDKVEATPARPREQGRELNVIVYGNVIMGRDPRTVMLPPREAGLAMNITTSMAIHRYQMLKDAGVARAEEAQYLKRCPVGGGLMLSGVPLTPVEKLHPRVQKWLREV